MIKQLQGIVKMREKLVNFEERWSKSYIKKVMIIKVYNRIGIQFSVEIIWKVLWARKKEWTKSLVFVTISRMCS